ncbi:MAG: acyltransferase family protein [Pseudomonadales bacterium]|nr:acyltransferase family protein [Pseudomonadales bacterium]
MSALQYRRDIDGLRAIAVTLVIFFHYQFPFFSGGFIGVDVFFVISGFLITGLLLKVQSSDDFSFSTFYSRRIRRLLPSFLLVSLVTFIVISRYYMDDDYYIFSKSWLGSVVGLSNIYFHGELSQYFSADAKIISLLHTWSLAVEEQFYLIWPLLLLLCKPLIKQPKFVLIFITLWLAAFTFSTWHAIVDPVAAYFLLPARLFELMLGCGLSLFAHRLPELSRWQAESISLIGLVAIVASAILLNSESIFPGYNALWPTAGAALIIYAGMSSHTSLVTRLLSTKALVFLGTLSYSLYLWHWPPVALLNYQLVELTLPIKVSLISFAFFAAWFTHAFVENSLRYRQWSLRKTFGLLILLPCVLIWLVQLTIRTNDDISFRIPEEKRALYKIMQQQNAGDLYEACFDGADYDFDQSESCLFGNATSNGKPNSMLLGDSHATAMIGLLEQLVADTPFYFLAVTKASAPFIAEPNIDKAFAGEKDRQRSRALQQYLTDNPSLTVFINNWWTAYTQNSENIEYTSATIDWLIKQGHRVIIIEDVPGLPSQSHAYCLIRGSTDCDIDALEIKDDLHYAQLFRTSIEARHPEVLWINPRLAICDQQGCKTTLDGLPLYRDDHHLNYLGSKKLGEEYLRRFTNPLEDLQIQ